MPNLVKFREDPDAMLVMALEDYDEVSGKATKAAIMHRDVVGKTPPDQCDRGLSRAKSRDASDTSEFLGHACDRFLHSFRGNFKF